MNCLVINYKKFILFYLNVNVFRNRKVINKILNLKYKFFILFLYHLYSKYYLKLDLYKHSLFHFEKKWFYYISQRLNKNCFNFNWVSEKNYYFWHFFNNDVVTRLLINLIMKDGKKYISYKHIYKCFFLFKKLLKVNGLLLIKKLLLKKRFWFLLKKITLKTRILYIPKLLSIRNQLTRTLKFLFNNFNLSVSNNKKISYYKKLFYFLLDEFLFETKLNLIMKKQYLILKKHSSFLYKEELRTKYMTRYKNFKKIKLYKKGRKSWTRREKQVLRFKKSIDRKHRTFDRFKSNIISFETRSLFKYRYSLNLVSRLKLKKKWSLL